MDDEMIERVADSLIDKFKEIVATSAGTSFDETLVIVPHRSIWLQYAHASIKAMREPTEKMLALGPEVQCWPEVIGAILGE